MSFVQTTRELLDGLGDSVFGQLTSGEELTLNLAAEDQHYLRFNGGRVRQSTRVRQQRLALRYQALGRRVDFTFDLSGGIAADLDTTWSLLQRARAEVTALPEDAYLTVVEQVERSDVHHEGRLPPLDALLTVIAEEGRSADFTGLYAGGTQLRATRNSRGLRHVFSTESFFVDYSLYTVNAAGENKAVKGLYAGRHWEAGQFLENLRSSRERLSLLEGEGRALEPGNYRVYFAPAAVDAIIALFSWGAVSYSAWKKGDSALMKLIEDEVRLSPLFSLNENFALGLTPRFNSLGEVAPETLPVIEQGRLRHLLINSRTAREYAVPGNAAENGEGLRSPDMATGTLLEANALAALDTGLYIGNLHYLNWSDLQHARITGMTRYACFWVENGRIVAPIRDLRFDETLYRIFGSELEAVGATAEWIMRTDTYHQRSVGGSRVPGMLVRDFRFTL